MYPRCCIEILHTETMRRRFFCKASAFSEREVQPNSLYTTPVECIFWKYGYGSLIDLRAKVGCGLRRCWHGHVFISKDALLLLYLTAVMAEPSRSNWLMSNIGFMILAARRASSLSACLSLSLSPPHTHSLPPSPSPSSSPSPSPDLPAVRLLCVPLPRGCAHLVFSACTFERLLLLFLVYSVRFPGDFQVMHKIVIDLPNS